MRHRSAPIVGRDVEDQRRVRPARPIESLDAFIEFLTRLEAVFGPIERKVQVTSGKRFRL